MATPLTIGLLLATAATQAIGSISEGNAQKSASRANARVAQRNAVISKDNAAADAAALNRENRKRLGLIRANTGASGIGLEGSALDVLEDNTATATLNELNVTHKGELQALGFEESAVVEREIGDSSKDQSLFRAGSAVFTGVGRALSVA